MAGIHLHLLKKLICILLITITLLPGGLKVFVFADYHLNLSSIIQKHCINKNKPSLQCLGKCYLAKKIGSLEKQENNLVSFLKNIQESPYTIPYVLVTQEFYAVIVSKPSYVYLLKKYSVFSLPPLHPPQ